MGTGEGVCRGGGAFLGIIVVHSVGSYSLCFVSKIREEQLGGNGFYLRLPLYSKC